jgi:hypothetical protein
MSGTNQRQLDNTLWKVADELCGAMNADNFHYKALFDLFSCDFTVDNYIHGDVTQ